MYYDEPGTTEFDAEVTAIREAARVDGRQVWQIALDRTAFYPTSGGQPFDTGTLVATARSGTSLHVPITNVEEDDLGEVWHTTGKPLQEGTIVHGIVNAERRRDHMQQHSGQHLLSAVLDRDLGARTVSFHLGAQHCTIDLVSEPVPEQALANVEQAVNRVVTQALPVSIRYVSQAEAEDLLAAGVLRKLPPRTGRFRLIEIPGIDLNACGGTHVATTAEIGPVLLRGSERVRDVLRLSFLCGDRALGAARADFQRMSSLAKSLSTGTAEIPDTIARLQSESRSAGKERSLLLQSLASADAASIAAQDGSLTVVSTLDAQKPGRDAIYAKQLASSLVGETTTRVALIAVVEGDRVAVALAARPGLVDCGTVLRTALAEVGGRGGGSRENAQGSLPVPLLNDFLRNMKEKLPL